MLKLIQFNNKPLIEDRQYQDAKLAFAHKEDFTVTELHPKCYCRDFLTDILIAEKLKYRVNKYGFNYDPEKTKIDLDKTRLLYTLSTQIQKESLYKNLHILNKIEKELNVSLTTIISTEDEYIFLIEGSNWWLQTTIHFSFYTFLLKCLLYKYTTKSWKEELAELEDTNEGRYMLKVLPYFYKILEFLTSPKDTDDICGWEGNRREDWDTLHHSSGFLAMIAGKGTWNHEQNIYFRQFSKML